MSNRRLIDNSTNLTVNGASAGTYGGHIKVVAGNSRYHALLQEFRDIIRPAGVPREPRHSTVHHIRNTPGPPVTPRPRRLAPDRLRIAKSEFEEMFRNGAARRSDSP
jgi:cleavage and polyadenylation specificity factor subunit 1